MIENWLIVPLFVATYLDKNHNGIQKKYISESKAVLQEILFKSGFQYISIRRIWIHQKVALLQKAEFFQSCADLLESGLNLQESLKIYAEQANHKILKILAFDILDNMNRGKNIFEIQSNDFFDEFIVANLKQICNNQSNLFIFRLISGYYFEKVESQRRLKNVLLYPLITFVVLGVALYFALYMILPSVLQLVPVSKISFATQSLIYVKNYFWEIVGCIALFMSLLFLCRKQLSYIPTVARLEIIDLWSQLSFCLMNKFLFIDALHIVKDNFNPRISRYIYYVIENIQRGHEISWSFKDLPGINKAQLHLLKMGEISGCMEKNLKFISEQEKKFKKNISDKIIFWTQPFLLLIMGGVLLWILLGTVIPIYENFHEMGA